MKLLLIVFVTVFSHAQKPNFNHNITIIKNVKEISLTKIEKKIYIEGYYSSYDGGEGYFRWDSTINKSFANGGTIIDPTKSLQYQGKGEGVGCWIRQYSGHIKTEWFGIKTDGSDTTKQFTHLINYLKYNKGGTVVLPAKTISVSNLDFTACHNTSIIGQGKLSVIDFKYAKRGIGLNFGSMKNIGGTQYIRLSNLTLTNSSKRKLTTLLEFKSGPTRQRPTETSGFITLKNIFLEKGATKALSLVGVSHVYAESVITRFNTPIDYGLYISQDIDINTGLYTFINCSFRGKRTALVIEASKQLIDTILFQGCGFFNYDNLLAKEVIILNGKKFPIESVKFLACHIELRNSNKNKKVAIGFKGKIQAVSFDTVHLSCGTSHPQKQADYVFKFYNNGNYKGVNFNNISILRCKSKNNGGYSYYLEGNSSQFYIKNPIKVKGLITNITNPSPLKVDFKDYRKYLKIQEY